jgi:hypothetical protein
MTEDRDEVGCMKRLIEASPRQHGAARRVLEGWMHDIGRTQLEQQAFGESEGELESTEYEASEFEGGPAEFEGEFGEYEGEFGEYEGGALESSVTSPELESPLPEMQEMELASELLEVTGEQELEQFLSDVFSAVGQAAGNFIRSDTGQALGGILKDSLGSAAKQALPVVGRAIGDAAGGYGDIGAQAGSTVGSLLGLELEGLSAEDREFETARQLVRFVGSAAGQAAAAPRNVPPAAVARNSASRAARVYAPGLLPRLQGRSTRLWPRSGRWVRRGRTIVLFGF